MCACQLETQSLRATSGTIADEEDSYPYIGGTMDTMDTSEEIVVSEDIYTQLAEKDRDLELAAELGKALLDQNAELKKKHEQEIEEFNQKLEALTQEKHGLRLRMESVESEYESTVRELQNDIIHLRGDLEQQQQHTQCSDKERAQITHELAQQNERLTEELRKVTLSEQELQEQVTGLRQQVTARRSTLHDHVHQLELLRNEISMLSERRSDLERRIVVVTEERDSMACHLEEAQDRILMLDRQRMEQDHKIRHQDREISELQESNCDMHEKVESLSGHNSEISFSGMGNNSLLSELEMSGLAESLCEDFTDGSTVQNNNNHVSQAAQQITCPQNHPFIGFSFHQHSSLLDEIENDEDDIECDDDIVMASNRSGESLEFSFKSALPSPEEEEHPRHVLAFEQIELKEEILEVYRQLQRMVLDLKGHGSTSSSGVSMDDSSSSFCNSHLKAGCLIAVLQELRELMEDIVKRQKLEESITSSDQMDLVETKLRSLKNELALSQSQMEKMRSDMQFKDQQLKNRSDELIQLTNKLSMQQMEIQKLIEERDRLQDNAAGITKDDIVDQARQERDESREQMNSMERELAQSRLDLMSMDTQLMNTIEQKLVLSQQLEQWQLDVQDLVKGQVVKQLEVETSSRRTTPTRTTPTTTPPTVRRKFHFPWS